MPVGDISADGADIAQNDGEDPEGATPVDAGAEAGTDKTGAGAPENDNDENADDDARDTTDSTEDAEPDARHTDALDRKSVVEGKSVSVRVDLGGRRIHQKKHILKKK